MRHSEKSVPGRIIRLGHAQANPQREARLSVHPLAQCGAVRRSNARSGHGHRPLCRVGNVELHWSLAAPRLECRPNGPGQEVMARPHRLDPLLFDHIQGFAQAVKVMSGRSAPEILVKLLRTCPRPPIPIACHAIGILPRRIRLAVEIHKRHAGRRHQSLLAGGNHEVDAPLVHFESIASQGGNAVDH